MGLNWGSFCQIKRKKRLFLVPVESDGFKGVFLGESLNKSRLRSLPLPAPQGVARASECPRCFHEALRESFPAQVIPRHRIRPRPFGSWAGVRGACMKQEYLQLHMLSGLSPNSNPMAPKIFPAIWIFVRKNLAVQTFVRNFFGFFRFRTGKNPAGKISRQLFLRFSTFAPKIFRFLKFHGQKKFGFSDPIPPAMEYDLRRGSESVAELTTFFPTFAPTFFGFFKFQSKNF